MLYRLLNTLDRLVSFKTAQAHCDVPCGVYDPITAQIAAMTVARMTDTLIDLENHENKDHGGKKDLAYQNTMSRMVAEKEKSAEIVKHEIRIIWGDFFKEKHLDQSPDLHAVTHAIMQLGSKCKQNVDVEATRALVEKVNTFAEMFWKAKGIGTKKSEYHCKPGLPIVYPTI